MLSYKEYKDRIKIAQTKLEEYHFDIVSDDEVEQINNSNGVKDLPRKQPLDLNEFWGK